MDGLRSFVEVDNRSAVDVGGLRRGARSIHVKKPQFREAFPEAVIRKGADKCTLEEVGSLKNHRWWKERIGKLCTVTTES